MIYRLIDWKYQVAQTILPLLLLPFFLVFDVTEFLIDKLSSINVDVQDLDIKWRIAVGFGKWFLLLVILCLLYYVIRKNNKKRLLKQTLPNRIVWHSYFGYWFCRKILNYRIVSLTRVPIPVQFELVWKGLFDKYEYMENVNKLQGNDSITIEFVQTEPFTNVVNLILADTYPIDNWKSKIPSTMTFYSTIIINRLGERGVRYFSKEFVSKIASVAHELPSTVKVINIFATINTAHVYHIVNEVFKTGGRDDLLLVRVYQQTSGTWIFDGKQYKELQIGV